MNKFSINIEALYDDLCTDDIQNSALVLTPNHNTSVQLLEACGAAIKLKFASSVCITPAIYAVDIWIRNEWQQLLNAGTPGIPQCLVLEPSQELFLWKSIIRNSSIGATLLNLEATAISVQEAYRIIQQWEISVEELHEFSTSVFKDGTPYEDNDIFLYWLKEYEQRSQQENLISLSQLLVLFIKALDEELVSLPEKITLLGFDNPPPIYKKLFQSLQQGNNNVNFLQLKAFNPRLEKKAFNNQEQELIAAAQWSQSILKKNSNAKIAVICPDLHSRAREVQRVFSNCYYPDNIFPGKNKQNTLFSSTASTALDSVPFINIVFTLLSLSIETMGTLEFCQLLRSPFITHSEAEAKARAALEFKLRKNSESIVHLAKVRYLALEKDTAWFCPALGQVLLDIQNLFQRNKKARTCSEWADIIEHLLRLVGWPGEQSSNTTEQQDLKCWYDLLKEYKNLGYLSGLLSYADAVELLKDLSHHTPSMRFHNHSPVQILNPVEAAGLQFTHVWFTGLSEKNWPPALRNNPFIPIKIQKTHNLPAVSPGIQYQAAKDLLHQFVNNSQDKIILSHPLQEEDVLLKPSMLLEEFAGTITLEDESKLIATLHPLSQELFTSASSTADIEIFNDTLIIPLQKKEKISGGISLIADQATCPFRSFANHRLKAKELPRVSYGLPAFAVGHLLHDAMEVLWQDLKDQHSINRLSSEQLHTLISKAAASAVKGISKRYPQTMTVRYCKMETERLIRLLSDWMDEERKRGFFSVVEHEYPLQWQYSTLKLNFRIDRIEQFEDNTFGLVDYKSSKQSNVNWLDERQDKPQMPLYLQAAECDPKFPKISSLLYAQITIEEMKYKGIAANAEVYPGVSVAQQKRLPDTLSWEALKQHWQLSLEALAQEFLDGYVAITPKSRSSCQYCHLGALCRIQEKRQQI